MGFGAGQNISTGDENTSLGYEAGQGASTGLYNTLIGSQVAPNLTTGSSNTIVGRFSGAGITTGSGNTIIGYNGGLGNISNSIVIADGNGNNRIFVDSAGQVGIGTRLGAAPGENFASLTQREKIFFFTRLHSQPRGGHTLRAGNLQPVCQSGLKLSECLSVRHALFLCQRSTKGLDFGHQFITVHRFGDVVSGTLTHAPYPIGFLVFARAHHDGDVGIKRVTRDGSR